MTTTLTPTQSHTMSGPEHHRATQAPRPTTPYLELDVPAAVAKYEALAASLPGTAVHYAVKANPHPRLLAELAAVGCRFDVASPAEVRSVLRAGAEPADLVYSNPVKRRDHIAEAAAMGVRLFVVDSLAETVKVAEAAPGSQVLCRLVTSGEGSDWPLSRKYGCSTYESVEILVAAHELGLDAAGLSLPRRFAAAGPRGVGGADRRRRPGLHAAAEQWSRPPDPRPRRRVPGRVRRGLPTDRGLRRGRRATPPPRLRRRPAADDRRTGTRHRR